MIEIFPRMMLWTGMIFLSGNYLIFFFIKPVVLITDIRFNVCLWLDIFMLAIYFGVLWNIQLLFDKPSNMSVGTEFRRYRNDFI